MGDAQRELQDHEIVSVAEFADLGPVLGCAVIPACAIALFLSWLLNTVDAPGWTQAALGAAYATLPCAAFLRWTWNKPAIRLSDGRVLRTAAARRLAVAMWLVTAAILIWRVATW
jgi:hypothetical protein